MSNIEFYSNLNEAHYSLRMRGFEQYGNEREFESKHEIAIIHGCDGQGFWITYCVNLW